MARKENADEERAWLRRRRMLAVKGVVARNEVVV